MNNLIPLSFFQLRLWFLDQFDQSKRSYNFATIVVIRGTLNVNVLKQSLHEIILRHEILRTNFPVVDEQPSIVVSSDISLNIPLLDLRHLSSDQQKAEVKRQFNQEAQLNFKLEHGELYRFKLLRVNKEEYALFLTFHHIIFDSKSLKVLIEELAVLYEAFSKNKWSPLLNLPFQYTDFAVWQNKWLESETLECHLDYWKKQLCGELPVLQIPIQNPKLPLQLYRENKHSIVLPEKITESLKTLSKREGVSLFTILLAVFKILLYRYSRQEDVIVGIPADNRNQFKTENLIGLFSNTLALRTNLSGNPCFRELLHRVNKVVLETYVNKDVPLGILIDKITPKHDRSLTPLFRVMFTLEEYPISELEFSDLSLCILEVDTRYEQFDFLMCIKKVEQRMEAVLKYNTELFDDGLISRMLKHFHTLLESTVVNPDIQISSLPILTESEQQQLLVEWNPSSPIYPKELYLHKLFETQVEKRADSIAVIFEDEQLTYWELNKRANQLGNYLQTLGIGPEVLVGVYIERSLDLAVGILGTFKAGGVCVPLDPEYPAERLNYMLNDSKPPVLLTQKPLLRNISQYSGHIVCIDTNWDRIAKESNESPFSELKAENLAYIFYTSGSTGNPKGVMVSHLGCCHEFWAQTAYQLTHQDRRLIQSIHLRDLFWPLGVGGQGVLVRSGGHRDIAYLTKLISEQQITDISLSPSTLEALLEVYNLDKCNCLKYVNVGGEALSVTLQEKFFKLLDASLIHTYGITEISSFATLWKCKSQPEINQNIVPIGHPVAGMCVYLLDSYLQPVPIGVSGELYIDSICLARGYLNKSELTARKFIPNPFSNNEKARLFKTGDMGRYKSDGTIELLGRIDNQVKVRGYRVEKEEIELVLNQHSSVYKNVVVVQENILGKNHLVAYVVPMKKNLPTKSELRYFLRRKLPDFMIPSTFILLDTLPLTPNGKIDRTALPSPNQTRQISEDTLIAPRNELELQLIQIWKKVLGIKDIGVKDDFFELGGDSLLAVKLFAEIEKTFHKKFPLAALFQAPTIEKLAKILSQEKYSSSWYSLVPIQPIGDKTPLFAIHLLGEGLSFYRPLASYLGQRQPIYGLNYGLAARKGNEEEVSLPPTKDLAAHYIKEMQAFQPQGPYILLGVSNGGNVAFEMAKQLHAQGQTVAKLILFDTVHPNVKLPPNWKNMSNFQKLILDFIRHIDIHWGNLLLFEPKERLPYFFDKIKKISTNWFPKLPKTLSLPIRSLVANDNRKTQAINSPPMSSQHYIPQSYPGKITLFKAKHTAIASSDPTNGWEGVAEQGLEIYNIHGAHSKILSEPSVRILAENLISCIDKL